MTALAPDLRDGLIQLSGKEQACLRLVARRRSSKQIARELGIAKTSVDTYCNRARAKLGVSDRYEAARLLLAGEGPTATAEPRPPLAVAPAAAQDRRTLGRPVPRPRLAASLAAALAVILALATLLSGLRALEVMKPLPSHGRHSAAAPSSPQRP
jgi:DNA-binding CsgD family transcriptional regulator